jgi:hypothetical protein
MLALMRRANETCAYVCIIKQARRVYGRALALAEQPQRARIYPESVILSFNIGFMEQPSLKLHRGKNKFALLPKVNAHMGVSRLMRRVLISAIFTAWKLSLPFQSKAAFCNKL